MNTPTPHHHTFQLSRLGEDPGKEELSMHPADYVLVQRAADSQSLPLAEFILLAAYTHARDVLAALQEPCQPTTEAGLCAVAHTCPHRPMGSPLPEYKNNSFK